MYGLEIIVKKLLLKMQTLESLNLIGTFCVAIEIHIASFYLSNCEVKS